MQRAQDGDKEAFQTLFREIGPLVTAFVRRRVRDQAEVEDICQETLIAVYRSRQTYQPSRPFEPWLFAIVRNVTAEYMYRQRQRSGWQEPMENIPDAWSEDDSGVTIALREAFASLPSAQLEAIRLTKVMGLSVDEASVRAGTSPGSIKVRVHRAFESLKRTMLR